MTPLEALAVDYVRATEVQKDAGNKLIGFMQPKSSHDFREYNELIEKAEETSKATRLAFAALVSHVRAVYENELWSF